MVTEAFTTHPGSRSSHVFKKPFRHTNRRYNACKEYIQEHKAAHPSSAARYMRKACGVVLLVLSLGALLLYLTLTFFSKLLPEPEGAILKAIREDTHYCLLIPVTIQVAVIAVYFNWFSINLYKSS